MKIKNVSAFPVPMNPYYGETGLTKREYFASQFLAALIASPNPKPAFNANQFGAAYGKDFVPVAVQFADELLRRLET